jgi:NAD(P)-dependent dehydrogenase (short-subunit alcohol dehydrogenase family)
LALAAEGASVAICDIAAQIDSVPYPLATKSDLDETVELVRRAGGQCLGLVADVRDTDQVNSAVAQTVSHFGRLDILVANAGICGYRSFGEISDETWNDMIETNLGGTFRSMRAVLPHMTSQGWGRVVAISSGAGRAGAPNIAHYSATKWGIIGLVKTFALETAQLGITANVICPTTVRTPMVENEQNYRLFCPEMDDPTLEDALPRLATLNPMRKPWLEPEVVSRAVLYLVNDRGFVSGSVLEVSMGASAYRP